MSVATLEDYEQSLGALPDEATLGKILWFTIAGVRVTHEQMEVWFNELGLDHKYLPKRIKPIDAFRTATSEAKAEYTLADGTKAELMIREVASETEQVVRHIVREIKDAKGHKLSYDPKVGEAVFYRQGRTAKTKGVGGEKVRFSLDESRLSSEEQEHAKKMLSDLYSRYHDLCAYLQSQAVRAVIRNYVTDLNAIAVKPSGGVYFVHKSRKEILDKVEELVNRLGGRSMMHTLPLVDTDKQRQMLTEAYQDEVEGEVRALLKEIAEVNAKAKQGKIPAAAYARLQQRYQEGVARCEEHTRVFGLAQGRAGAALELALDAVVDMATRIEG